MNSPGSVPPHALCCLILCTGLQFLSSRADPVDFSRDIAPLLTSRCIGCHNPVQRKGELSLVSETDLAEAGVLAGNDGEISLLLRMIMPSTNGEAPSMPAEGDPLAAEEVELVRQWIARGAPWPEGMVLEVPIQGDPGWWSLQPLAPVRPPDPEPGWKDLARNGIDAFIQRTLHERGLRPSPEADRGTLIRRLSFDLLGLPPAPEEIDAFLEDPRPDAFERLVDRLLASPRYGERWGRHWLDVIRFGESSGYERNIIRDNAWPFRDYVIRSLNQDKPYDRFVREHLAGDQLGPLDPEVEVGTGFLVGGAYDDVGNQDPLAARLIRANTIDDMINATASAFLGLTVACARCHDHKFDPIPQTDYYRMQAAFAGVQQGSRVLATSVEREAHRARREPLEAAIAEVDAEREALRKRVLDRIRPRLEEVRRSFTRPKADPYLTEETFDPVEARQVRIRITRTTRGRYAGAVIDEFEVWTPGEDGVNVALASRGGRATASSMRTTEDGLGVYAPAKAIDGAFGEWWISQRNGGTLTVRFPRTERVARVVWSNDRERFYERGRTRPFSTEYVIETSLAGESWTAVADSEGREPYDQAHLDDHLFDLEITPRERSEWGMLGKRRNDLNRELRALAPLPAAWIGNFRQPEEPTYLMRGGDPARLGPEVAPGSLQVLASSGSGFGLEGDADEASRRSELARWITRPGNALFARVMVNRLWHYHFGIGIVSTPSDFGAGGSRPSHPELLDWLAAEFIRHDFRLKPLHRLILASHTWRQASLSDASMQARDGESRLLWRYPPRRLEAEAIRDSILRISGSLDTRMGGPGFRLYRYTVDNVATYHPLDVHDESTHRRSVYHQHVRAVEVDILSDFDCPDPALPAPRRTATTSPQQAMSLQNHSFILQQAQRLAERLEGSVDEDEERIRLGFRLAFGREPAPRELEEGLALAEAHGLSLFCRALINANEFIHLR